MVSACAGTTKAAAMTAARRSVFKIDCPNGKRTAHLMAAVWFRKPGA
jgi:hypothetical protein